MLRLLARRLSVCWPVAARPSLSCLLVCLLARRCSSVADTLLVCLLVHHWLSLSCTCSWSLVCLLVRLLPSPPVSSSVSSSIARHWSVCSGQGRCPVVGLLLVCHLPVVGHGRSCVCSFVARCSPVAPPACPSLACLLVRCFPVCCSFTSLSARAMVAGSSLVHLLPVAAPSTGVVTGPSLVCPLVRHSSI